MAAARDHLFPKVFAKENKSGVPGIGIVVSSVLVSVLMSMNFSRSLADTYTFIILLSTLTVLVPYLFSVISYMIIEGKNGGLMTKKPGKVIIAVLAFVYSMWAVIGSGEEIVYWGFILLMAGLPFYAWIQLQRKT